MAARTIPTDPFDIVVFGATGDLARRKLIPALYFRDESGQIAPESRIFGVSRSKLSDEAFRDVWRKREARFFAEEIAGIARYSARFFDDIAAITERALAP